ncbi:MAG TPA: ECF-type sigma factor [Bryobacteraceae bacterium]|nr:ECF-type sigma factor [Bryobacteraceae bacterium]
MYRKPQVMVRNQSLTERLQLFMKGDTGAANALVGEILPKLREIALRALRREGPAAPLSRTELINELWARRLSKGGWRIQDRQHFYALASLAMRRLLTDMARERLCLCRGEGASSVPLDECDPIIGTSLDEAERIVGIGLLMEKLEAEYPDAARVVDMHYFSGFTLDEIARETGLTFKQVRFRWDKGLRWLKRKSLAPEPSHHVTGLEASRSRSLARGLTKQPAT